MAIVLGLFLSFGGVATLGQVGMHCVSQDGHVTTDFVTSASTVDEGFVGPACWPLSSPQRGAGTV